MPLRKLAGFTLLLLAFSAPAHAEWFCPTWARWVRTGHPACWIEVRLADDRVLCIPRDPWIARVNSDLDPMPCGDWPGVWKISATLRNREQSPPKQIRHRWVASGFPKSSARVGWVTIVRR